jgi:hypothetical protein
MLCNIGSRDAIEKWREWLLAFETFGHSPDHQHNASGRLLIRFKRNHAIPCDLVALRNDTFLYSVILQPVFGKKLFVLGRDENLSRSQ